MDEKFCEKAWIGGDQVIEIQRSALISEIIVRSEDSSILITGSPGAGKSWVCAEVARALENDGKRLVFAIAAEEHAVTSLDDLRASLGLDTDVVSFLNSVLEGSVLLIDGLDSLRGDPSQNTFRELIRRIFADAPRCTVIASIRTFDLRKSPEFQKLFFSSGFDARNKVTEIVVPELSDVELATAAANDKLLRPLINEANPSLRKLLRNPFNLTLAFSLIGGGALTADLSGFDSQVQLLNKYWDWRVSGREDRYERLEVLRLLLERIVAEQSLSVRIAGMYHPGLGRTLVGLQSDEILKESSTGRMAFEHNILFDYALCRVLLDEQNVIGFVESDPNRTIFYRPSLAYFFYYLWLTDREAFWTLSFSFARLSSLPERARIIPEATIYEAARSPEDLSKILSLNSESETKLLTGVLRALLTFGGINANRRSMWISVLQRLGVNLKMEFVNEFASLLNAADEAKSADEAKDLLELSTRFLRWMWHQSQYNDFSLGRARLLADFASARVFPVVLRNYSIQPDLVRDVVKTILSRYKDDRASASEAFRLANEIAAIIAADPETAVEIYRETFGHEETSLDETRIGGSAVLSFISNRAQDFSTALYALQAKFKGFLQVDPFHAVDAAIQSVNLQVERKYGPETGRTMPEFTLSYGQTRGLYRADGSEVWDMGGPELLSLNLLTTAIASSATKSSGAPPLDYLISKLVSTAEYAVLWKRLFTITSSHVGECFADILPLLLNPKLISAPEVTIAVGNFIGAAFKAGVVSPDSEAQLVRTILSIPDTQIIVKYENPESIRNRLLMCIPRASVTSQGAQEIYDQLLASQNVRRNKPYVTYDFFQGTYGTNDYLRDQGANTDLPDNKIAIEVLEELQNWESRFLNSVPSDSYCAEVESRLREMDALIRKGKLEKPVATAARGAMCAVAKAVLRNGTLSKSNSAIVLSRRIVLSGTNDEMPRPSPAQDTKFDMPSWGGGLARIEAAQGLMNYLRHWGSDRSISAAINKLSHDPVPAVRFQIATGLTAFWVRKMPAKFWKMLESMITGETTPGVMTALVNAAGAVAGVDPDRAAKALVSAVNRALDETDRSELRRYFLQAFVGLYVARDNAIANEQLLEFESQPERFDREVSEEVYALSAYIAREGKDNSQSRARSREVLTRIVTGVYAAMERLSEVGPDGVKQEQFTKLLKILDHVAIKLFHILGIDPYGSVTSERPDNAWLYWEIKPLLKLLATHEAQAGKHFLAAHTANYLMQTFNGIVQFDPEAAVEFAAAVCKAAKDASYQFEREAVSEMTKLTERILADHRELLKKPTIAAAMGAMLDLFATVGWPEVWSLTMRLDDAIR